MTDAEFARALSSLISIAGIVFIGFLWWIDRD